MSMKNPKDSFRDQTRGLPASTNSATAYPRLMWGPRVYFAGRAERDNEKIRLEQEVYRQTFEPRGSGVHSRSTNCSIANVNYYKMLKLHWFFDYFVSVFQTSYRFIHTYICEPGSSVGIAIDYWLDGPGSNPGGDEIFRPSRPALGSTQTPVKWVPGLSRG